MVNWNDDTRPRDIKEELEAIRKLIEAILDAILLRKLEDVKDDEHKD